MPTIAHKIGKDVDTKVVDDVRIRIRVIEKPAHNSDTGTKTTGKGQWGPAVIVPKVEVNIVFF